MTSISEFLTTDHKSCDRLFADAEAAVGGGDWANAKAGYGAFQDALQQHFAMEEEVLFPAFETASGMTQGPTQVMRAEHRQMSNLLNLMSAALARKDASAWLGDADTLLILMQQHNVKEEQMLYPMAERALAGKQGELLVRMRQV